jgi:hypothetical protein
MAAGEREYDYKPRWRMIVVSAAFGVPGAVCCAVWALSNMRQAVMNGHPAPPGDAPHVIWLVCAVSLALLADATFRLYQRFGLRRRIVLGRDALVYPASPWREATRTIPYRNIEKIQAAVGPRQALFVLIRAPGTKFRVDAGWLASDEAFDDFCCALAGRVAAAGGARVDGAALINAGVSKVRDRSLARELLVMGWLTIAPAALILCGSAWYWVTKRSVPTEGLVLGTIVLACGTGLRWVAKSELRRHSGQDRNGLRAPVSPYLPGHDVRH